MPHRNIISIFCIALAAVVARLWLLALPFSGLNWDAFYYLRLADNLSASFSYSLDGLSTHTKFAPGFPFLIAAARVVFSSSFSAAHFVVFLSGIFLLLVTYRIGRAASAETGFYALGLCAMHHLALVHTAVLFSELPFACLSGIALLSITRKQQGQAILFACLAALIRYEGLLLLPLLVHGGLPRRLSLRTLLCGFSGIVLLACWFLSLRSAAGSIGSLPYVSELRLPGVNHFLDQSLTLLRLGPVFLGLAALGLLTTRPISPHTLWVLSFSALHFVWWYKDVRFYVAILPSLCLFAALGLQWLRQRRLVAGSIVSVLFFFAVGFEQHTLLTSREADYRLNNSKYLQLFDAHSQLVSLLDQKNHRLFFVPEKIIYQYFLPPQRCRSFRQLLRELRRADINGDPFAVRSILVSDSLTYFYPGLSDAWEKQRVLFQGKDGRLRRRLARRWGRISVHGFGKYRGIEITLLQ